jgi:glucose-1-phosphate adenylyltransferase
MKKECVAMLLAGGQGSRLYALTQNVAKPAVPFGGKYRIIDFPLSNCVNSGVDTVGVLTQYQPLELNVYLGNGEPWDLDRANGGLHSLAPYTLAGDAGSWYKGTANAIYQNIGFIDQYDPEYVFVLSGDNISKMDYREMLKVHKANNAAATISVLTVTMEEAKRFGIMNVRDDDSIYEFEEKPANPKSNLASMGVYCFTWSKLRQYLVEDEADPNSYNDFGKNIIPNMLAAGETMMVYRFDGYWKDVGTINSLWDANMDILDPNGDLSVYDQKWPLWARNPIRPPHLIQEHASINHSFISSGCVIDGDVQNSIISDSVEVGHGAIVRYSVLMPGAKVMPGATVEYAILAEDVVVGAGAHVGSDQVYDDPNKKVAVVGKGVEIAAGAQIEAGAMLYPEKKGGDK